MKLPERQNRSWLGRTGHVGPGDESWASLASVEMTQHHAGDLINSGPVAEGPSTAGPGSFPRRSLRGLGRTVVSVVASIPTVEAQVQLAASLLSLPASRHRAPHGLGRVCLVVVVIVDFEATEAPRRGSRLAGAAARSLLSMWMHWLISADSVLATSSAPAPPGCGR